ncbi:MAG: ABC transporter ATP-binding protein [Paludibacteraceae bacterium]|nr:ABC transporter ATP-binding protein [Paludibacteraceae bacterium]
MGTIVELKNLSIGYKEKDDILVVEKMNATLYSGQLTCLLGPNGAGKSTLLRTLCKFQPPIEGQITVNGRNLSEFTNQEMARLVSVVLTHNQLYLDLTAFDVVAMGRMPYTGVLGILTNDDYKVIDECVRQTGIENLLKRKIATLSDGERQKVMVAKALAQQTPIIYLDEPTAFLDFPSKVQLLQMLSLLSRQLHKIVFLSTHDVEQALQVSDQIWLLDQQFGLVTGTPNQLCDQNKIGTYFGRKGLKFDPLKRTFIIN